MQYLQLHIALRIIECTNMSEISLSYSTYFSCQTHFIKKKQQKNTTKQVAEKRKIKKILDDDYSWNSRWTARIHSSTFILYTYVNITCNLNMYEYLHMYSTCIHTIICSTYSYEQQIIQQSLIPMMYDVTYNCTWYTDRSTIITSRYVCNMHAYCIIRTYVLLRFEIHLVLVLTQVRMHIVPMSAVNDSSYSQSVSN